MQPTAQTALTNFLLKDLRGVLRPTVVNHAFGLLHNFHRAAELESIVSVETNMALRHDHLLEQLQTLVRKLQRQPCPSTSFIKADEMPELIMGVINRIRMFERHLVALIADGVDRMPPATDVCLTNLCAGYAILLQLGHSRFLESEAFESLMSTINAYHQNVIDRIVPQDITDIEEHVLEYATSAMDDEQELSSDSSMMLARLPLDPTTLGIRSLGVARVGEAAAMWLSGLEPRPGLLMV